MVTLVMIIGLCVWLWNRLEYSGEIQNFSTALYLLKFSFITALLSLRFSLRIIQFGNCGHNTHCSHIAVMHSDRNSTINSRCSHIFFFFRLYSIRSVTVECEIRLMSLHFVELMNSIWLTVCSACWLSHEEERGREMISVNICNIHSVKRLVIGLYGALNWFGWRRRSAHHSFNHIFYFPAWFSLILIQHDFVPFFYFFCLSLFSISATSELMIGAVCGQLTNRHNLRIKQNQIWNTADKYDTEVAITVTARYCERIDS